MVDPAINPPTILGAQKKIEEGRAQVAAAKTQVSAAEQEFRPEIPRTQAQLRQQTMQTGVQVREFQRSRTEQFKKAVEETKGQITTEEAAITSAEQQLSSLLSTNEGRVAYAKEAGISGKKITKTKGDATYYGYEYNTPYGKATEWTKVKRVVKEYVTTTSKPEVDLGKPVTTLIKSKTPQEFITQGLGTQVITGFEKGGISTPLQNIPTSKLEAGGYTVSKALPTTSIISMIPQVKAVTVPKEIKVNLPQGRYVLRTGETNLARSMPFSFITEPAGSKYYDVSKTGTITSIRPTTFGSVYSKVLGPESLIVQSAIKAIPEKIQRATFGLIPQKKTEIALKASDILFKAKVSPEKIQALTTLPSEIVRVGILGGPPSLSPFTTTTEFHETLVSQAKAISRAAIPPAPTMERISIPSSKQKIIIQRLSKEFPQEVALREGVVEIEGMKATQTRFIGLKVGDRNIGILEFSKFKGAYPAEELAGLRRTYAVELNAKGEPVATYGGVGISKSTESAEQTISKIVRQPIVQPTKFELFKQKYLGIQPKTPEAELYTFVQKGELVGIKNVQGKKYYITTEQARLLEQQGVDITKEIKFYSGKELAERTGVEPFTAKEWAAAEPYAQGGAVQRLKFKQIQMTLESKGQYNVLTGKLKTTGEGLGFTEQAPEAAEALEKVKVKLTKEEKISLSEFKKEVMKDYGEASTKYGLTAEVKQTMKPEKTITTKEFGKRIDKMYEEEYQAALKQLKQEKGIIKTSDAKVIAKIVSDKIVAERLAEEYPSIVSAAGTLGVTSVYAGKGLVSGYEVSTGMDLMGISKLKQAQPTLTIQKAKLGLKTTELLKTSTTQMQELGITPIQGLKIGQINLLKMRQALKLQPQLKLQPALKTTTKTTDIISPKITIKVPIVPPPTIKGKGVSVSKVSAIKSLFKAYEVQIRRKGKFFPIARGLPLGRAMQVGARRTMGTLAQTFRVVPRGTTTMKDIGFRIPQKVFTKLKKPTARIEFVERRGMTLKRGTGEIPEIQRAKKARTMKWL